MPRKKIFFIVLILSFIVLGRYYAVDRHPLLLNTIAYFLFDNDYYKKQYPEVKESSLFDHFMNKGWLENKNPNPWFDTVCYKVANQMFNKNGLNPLQHYVRSRISFKKNITRFDQINQTPVKKLVNPKHYLALVAIFRDEAAFLKEWIEFYRLMGVEKFYLYNHLSKDHYAEVLKPYIDDGIVELYHVTEIPHDKKSWDIIQVRAYDETIKNVANDVEWLIVVDTDEFLFPVKKDNLVETLKDYDDFPALSVVWTLFGSNGVDDIAEDELMIEKLTKSSGQPKTTIKSIVKPRFVQGYSPIHYPILKDGYAQIDEKKMYFIGYNPPKPTQNILRINHYWSRTLNFFKKYKLHRAHILNGNKDVDQGLMHYNQELSKVYDDSILRFVDILKKRMNILD